MQRFDDSVNNFIHDHTSPANDLLNELERETYLKVLRPRMVSGHLQGKVLEMLSQMIQPKYILELGTFTGYSALCLAKGLPIEGVLHTIDHNDELETFAQKYFDKSPYKNQIQLHIGDARNLIPTFEETFDLVFMDADKRQYSEYYDLIFDKINPGGYLIADDVLWYGKMNLDKPDDAYTKGLMDFNKKVQEDDRVENVLFPIRDGLMVVRKK